MSGDRLPTDGLSILQQNIFPNQSVLPRHESVSRSYLKPPRSHRRHADRSVSQRRRFCSTSGPRPNRREKQVLVKAQPAGWYQVDHVTRNLSLAPRLPTYEPLMTYSFSGDQVRRKRRARKNRRNAAKWSSQSRFPSPSVFGSTLGLLRELPCARLHYDSFRRIFPTLPTRTMKEKRFRTEAAKQLPFAKYPDDQLKDILDSSSKSVTVNDSQPTSWIRGSENSLNKAFREKSGVFQTEGDTQFTNDVSESSSQSQEDTKEDDIPEEDESEDLVEERNEDIDRRVVRQSDTEEQKGHCVCEVMKNPVGLQSEVSPSSQNRRSTPISEDFLSMINEENEAVHHNTSDSVVYGLKREEQSLPYIDTELDEYSVPLATYDDANTKSCDISAWNPSDQMNAPRNFAEVELRASGLETVPIVELPPIGNFSRGPSTNVPRPGDGQLNVPNGRESKTEEQDLLPTPQAAVTLFESVSMGRTTSSLACTVCLKPAYPAERLEADGKVFHVACFRCANCSTLLQRAAWNFRGQNYYCNPCHRRMALQTLRH
ncbi:Xin actin-binding repeat-containing protein 2 [Fasciolopsis buskii]|uniref:Xin actin-binding repeat-containing protein 2 n=1 Tax=Fasciolopsis buskii TaxID=27845 RepID=A0A8E0S5E3_9TREM|nr:Xin actin-binding repeat-containing protein 2 [Fasciolopsis buski]